MKTTHIITALLVLANAAWAQAQKWGYDTSHAKIGFAISHFGISETEGKFTRFNGTVLASKEDFSDAKIDISIEVNSINTEEPQRDAHLKSADFFDAEKYPTITFKSTTMKSTGKNKYQLTGILTMHGVTKPIVLEVIYKGTVVDPYNHTKAGFNITGSLDRTDFGLEWNGTLAAGGVLVGNTVSLNMNLELIKL